MSLFSAFPFYCTQDSNFTAWPLSHGWPHETAWFSPDYALVALQLTWTIPVHDWRGTYKSFRMVRQLLCDIFRNSFSNDTNCSSSSEHHKTWSFSRCRCIYGSCDEDPSSHHGALSVVLPSVAATFLLGAVLPICFTF